MTWPWVVAAAALFVVAVVLHGTATAPTLQSPTPTAAQLADFFGGGPAAAATAEFILASPLIASGHDDLAPVIPQ